MRNDIMEYMIACALIFVLLYANHFLGFLPKNWEDLFFHVEFSLFLVFIFREIMRRKNEEV